MAKDEDCYARRNRTLEMMVTVKSDIFQGGITLRREDCHARKAAGT
jgi:hypothetical protein